jgi:hypothetical protein
MVNLAKTMDSVRAQVGVVYDQDSAKPAEPVVKRAKN